jgi:hypothetical protein
MTPPDAKAQITADFCEMVRLLRQIDPPERHRCEVDPLALHWYRGDAIASVAHGAPITLRLHPRNDDTPAQLSVELRLFWRIASDPEAEGAPLRAVLRAERGRQIGHQATSLLDASQLQLAGDTPAMLYARTAPHLDRALARYRAFEARRFSRD